MLIEWFLITFHLPYLNLVREEYEKLLHLSYQKLPVRINRKDKQQLRNI